MHDRQPRKSMEDEFAGGDIEDTGSAELPGYTPDPDNGKKVEAACQFKNEGGTMRIGEKEKKEKEKWPKLENEKK